MLRRLIRYSCIYEAHMSLAPNRRSAIQHFKQCDAIEIRNRITFDFYMGLSHIYAILLVFHYCSWVYFLNNMSTCTHKMFAQTECLCETLWLHNAVSPYYTFILPCRIDRIISRRCLLYMKVLLHLTSWIQMCYMTYHCSASQGKFKVIASVCLLAFIYYWILLFTGIEEDDLRVLVSFVMYFECTLCITCSIQEPCRILILDI